MCIFALYLENGKMPRKGSHKFIHCYKKRLIHQNLEKKYPSLGMNMQLNSIPFQPKVAD
jgi:hypothetical protein